MKVTMYKTYDGCLFDTEKDAINHERITCVNTCLRLCESLPMQGKMKLSALDRQALSEMIIDQLDALTD